VQRLFAEIIGRASRGAEAQAIAAAKQAVQLDPLSAESRRVLIAVLASTRHYEEALAAYKEAQSVSIGKADDFVTWVFMAHLGKAQFEAAHALCASTSESWYTQQCLAVIYAKLGRQADAQAELAKLQKTLGETGAFQYAEIYAQWGDTPQALHWLEVAYKLRDSGLSDLPSDPLLDPIRSAPRFVEIAQMLHFDSRG
jgi:tetratricopeptide (TPR) repeat protein